MTVETTGYDQLATQLAKAFSRFPFSDATIERASTETFDPRLRKTVKGAAMTLPARAAVETVKSTAADGSIKTSTRAILNVEPRTGDTIALGDSSYHVTDVSFGAPAGVALVYYAMVAA